MAAGKSRLPGAPLLRRARPGGDCRPSCRQIPRMPGSSKPTLSRLRASPGAETAVVVLQSSDAPRQATRRPGITLPQVFSLVTLALLIWGDRFPTQQYITPQTGAGYALGIAGGSAMLLLLVYPARKRVPALRFMGTTKHWFQAHMVLGIVGPVLILFHSNFSLGATNSNVALACMLVVSGSGLFGRYFYTRIHHGLHGRRASLAELREYAEKLRWVTTNVDFLPDLVARIESEEHAIVETLRTPAAARAAARRARPPPRSHVVGWAVMCARRLRPRAWQSSATPEAQPAAGPRPATSTIASPPRAAWWSSRRSRRLFSLWHALHMPLFLDAADRRRRARRRGARLLSRHRTRMRNAAPPSRTGTDDAGEPPVAGCAAASIETLLMPGKVSNAHAKLEAECSQCHDRSDRSRQATLCMACHKEVAADVRGHTGFHGRLPAIETAQCKRLPLRAPGPRRGDRQAQSARIRSFEDRLSAGRGACCGRLRCLPQAGAEIPRGSVRLRRLPQGRRPARRKARRGLRRLSRAGDLVAHPVRPRQDTLRAARCAPRGYLRRVPCRATATLGTPSACASCHSPDDVHRGSRGADCASCHTTVAWKTSKFDHARETRFALTGAHAGLACQGCHKTANMKDPLPVDCAGCHRTDDAHATRFGEACDKCHGTSAWKPPAFDHLRDGQFELVGRHATLACNACHTAVIAQQKLGTDCNACHRTSDAHGGKLGTDCAACHGVGQLAQGRGLRSRPDRRSRWSACTSSSPATPATCRPRSRAPPRTATDATSATTGTRARSARTAKHVTRRTAGASGSSTTARRPNSPSPVRTRVSPAQAATRQPADQVKLCADCDSCHSKDDVHLGQYGRQCQRCHVTTSFQGRTAAVGDNPWATQQDRSLTAACCGRLPGAFAQGAGSQFNHVTTGYELTGAHKLQACESCHVDAVFQGTPRACVACHSNGSRIGATPEVVGHILSSDGATPATRPRAGSPAGRFDHDQTRGSCASLPRQRAGAGKPAGHIATSRGLRRLPRHDRVEPARFDHGNIAANCVSCHDGGTRHGRVQ